MIVKNNMMMILTNKKKLSFPDICGLQGVMMVTNKSIFRSRDGMINPFLYYIYNKNLHIKFIQKYRVKKYIFLNALTRATLLSI